MANQRHLKAWNRRGTKYPSTDWVPADFHSQVAATLACPAQLAMLWQESLQLYHLRISNVPATITSRVSSVEERIRINLYFLENPLLLFYVLSFWWTVKELQQPPALFGFVFTGVCTNLGFLKSGKFLFKVCLVSVFTSNLCWWFQQGKVKVVELSWNLL